MCLSPVSLEGENADLRLAWAPAGVGGENADLRRERLMGEVADLSCAWARKAFPERNCRFKVCLGSAGVREENADSRCAWAEEAPMKKMQM